MATRPVPAQALWVVATVAQFLLVPAACAQNFPATRVELTVAATTDVHGHIRGWDYSTNEEDPVRGLARVASLLDSVRSANRGRVLLVDAGDLLQGTALTFIAGRVDTLAPHPVIAAMNAMEYDAAAIGNHEFNYGVPQLDRALAQAKFPFLAANARRLDGGPPFVGRTMVTRRGIKVAIIGVTNPGSMVWDRDNLKNRVIVDDIVAALPAQVQAARAEGADAVVVVAHAGIDGLTSFDTVATGVGTENPMARVAREVAGINLIVIGHTHREVADSTIAGVRVIQARNWATSVALATLVFERRDGKWRVAASRGQVLPVRGWDERRDIVRAVARTHQAAIAYAKTSVGRTTTPWRSDSARFKDLPITDFVAEVQRKVAGAELSIASVFSERVRFDTGSITVERLSDLYPYENTLRALKLSGTQIRAFLEYTVRYYTVLPGGRVGTDPTIPGYNFDALVGLDYTVDLRRPVGQRITSLTTNGREVTGADTFTVALNSYRSSGGGGYDMLRNAPVVYEGSAEIRTLLIEEIQRRGTIEPSDYFVQNWRVIPPDAPASDRFLRVIGFNDFHGALEKRPDGNRGNRGGAAELATMIRQARAECAPRCITVTLNGGDLFQGTPASNLTYGTSVVEVLNAIGVDAYALGNHEFDWGQDTLRARMRELQGSVFGVNVTDVNGRDAPWVPNDTLIERDGVKIGVIGIAEVSTPRTTMARNVADLRFPEPAPLVQRHAAALRQRGAQMVLLVAHVGAFCEGNPPDSCRGEIIDLANAMPRGTVDAIVSGHTHSEVRTVVNGTPIVQARSSARAIGIIDLPLSGGANAAPARPVVRAVESDRTERAPDVARIVDSALARVEGRINARIVETDATWTRSGAPLDEQYALGHLIADAQRAAGRGDIAVMNNGGIRAGLERGEVTWGDLYEVQPFANRLMVLTARGSDVRAYLERLVRDNDPRWHMSGVTVTFDSTARAGSRIRSITLANGQALADNRTYRVVMSNFLAEGGDGATPIANATVEDIGMLDLDALISYVRAMPNGRLLLTEQLQTPRLRPVP